MNYIINNQINANVFHFFKKYSQKLSFNEAYVTVMCLYNIIHHVSLFYQMIYHKNPNNYKISNTSFIPIQNAHQSFVFLTFVNLSDTQTKSSECKFLYSNSKIPQLVTSGFVDFISEIKNNFYESLNLNDMTSNHFRDSHFNKISENIDESFSIVHEKLIEGVVSILHTSIFNLSNISSSSFNDIIIKNQKSNIIIIDGDVSDLKINKNDFTTFSEIDKNDCNVFFVKSNCVFSNVDKKMNHLIYDLFYFLYYNLFDYLISHKYQTFTFFIFIEIVHIYITDLINNIIINYNAFSNEFVILMSMVKHSLFKLKNIRFANHIYNLNVIAEKQSVDNIFNEKLAHLLKSSALFNLKKDVNYMRICDDLKYIFNDFHF